MGQLRSRLLEALAQALESKGWLVRRNPIGCPLIDKDSSIGCRNCLEVQDFDPSKSLFRFQLVISDAQSLGSS